MDFEEEMRQALLARRLSQQQSRQSFWSELSHYLSAHTISVHLVVLFLTFLLLQTVHVHNTKKLRSEIVDFLTENELLIRGLDDDQVNQFMVRFGK